MLKKDPSRQSGSGDQSEQEDDQGSKRRAS
jgi:hypothetical protein